MSGIKRRTSISVYIQTYLFLIWDGLGFFGYDNHKLDRLKGIKPKWYDKFMNPYWIFLNFSFLLVLIIVMVGSL